MTDDDHTPTGRFYAVCESGRMECPRCGRLLVWGVGPRHPSAEYWQSVSSRITCPRCRKVYTLGVIAWPTSKGLPLGMPEDQQFSVRQLSELRQRAGGFYPHARYKRHMTVNRYIEDGCSCAPLPWRAECPVHGLVGLETDGFGNAKLKE